MKVEEEGSPSSESDSSRRRRSERSHRAVLESAIAHELEAGEYAFAHSEAIAEASAALSNTLENPEETVAYAASLDPELKRALIVAIINA